MTVGTVLVANAAVALFFGLALVATPEQLLSFYGTTTDAAGILLARLFGGAALGYAFLTWFARTAKESEARRAIVPALGIGWGVGFVVALVGQLSGVMNTLGWTIPGLYLLFTLGYGYLQFFRSSSS